MTRSSGDAFKLLAREARRWPLLTAEQEREAADLRDAKDPRGIDTLVHANVRLVCSIVLRYREYASDTGCGLDDMAQAGMIGLLTSARKFDQSRGLRFSTYATWWIRQTITRELSTSARTIRLPVHRVATLKHIREAELEYVEAVGHAPTTDELAEALGLPADLVEQTIAANRANVELGAIPSAMVPRDGSPSPERQAIDTQQRAELEARIAALPSRLQRVMRGRLDGRSLASIGWELRLTKERVRQLEAQAVAMLRFPAAGRAGILEA